MHTTRLAGEMSKLQLDAILRASPPLFSLLHFSDQPIRLTGAFASTLRLRMERLLEDADSFAADIALRHVSTRDPELALNLMMVTAAIGNVTWLKGAHDGAAILDVPFQLINTSWQSDSLFAL